MTSEQSQKIIEARRLLLAAEKLIDSVAFAIPTQGEPGFDFGTWNAIMHMSCQMGIMIDAIGRKQPDCAAQST